MQAKLFHDSIYDALRAIVEGTGGFKKVGVELWPKLPADKAGRDLSDCLNASNARTLDPMEMIWLLRRGREHDIHTGMAYLCQELHYEAPKPVDPESEKERLLREVMNELRESRARQTRLEALLEKAA